MGVEVQDGIPMTAETMQKLKKQLAEQREKRDELVGGARVQGIASNLSDSSIEPDRLNIDATIRSLEDTLSRAVISEMARDIETVQVGLVVTFEYEDGLQEVRLIGTSSDVVKPHEKYLWLSNKSSIGRAIEGMRKDNAVPVLFEDGSKEMVKIVDISVPTNDE